MSDTYNNDIARKHPNLFCPDQRASNPTLRANWDVTFKPEGCENCEEWSDVLGRCFIGGCKCGEDS